MIAHCIIITTAIGSTCVALAAQEIAELQEKQDNKEVAIEFYQQAGDLFAGEESTADANKCRLKVAQFSAELGKYPEVRLSVLATC